VISGDFNNDTKLDLAVTNSGSNTVSVLLGYGNGTFQTEMNYAIGSSPTSVISGDVNNDKKLDLMMTNMNSGDLSVLLNICE
jgi:hypothetical protein